jgi:endogenous inhibitor of DNA gyrase (YacG/DUF329 family)
VLRPLLPPPEVPRRHYLGVNCINPTCGKPLDVESVWPRDKRAFVLTLECPHCGKLSTYSHHEMREYRGG